MFHIKYICANDEASLIRFLKGGPNRLTRLDQRSSSYILLRIGYDPVKKLVTKHNYLPHTLI